MKRQARVVSCSPESVTLQLERTARCAGCPKNCNEPLFDLFSSRRNQFTLLANSPAYTLQHNGRLFSAGTEGELVELTIEDQHFMRSSTVFFLVPLLLMVAGSFLGHHVLVWLSGPADLGAGVGLLAGIGAGYWLLRQNILPKTLKIMPKVTILSINGT